MSGTTAQRSDVTPKRPLDGRTSGRADIGTWSRSHSSGSQRRSTMSNSIVRLAFVGSVANTSPPVRFHNSQVSIVPRARSSDTPTAPSVSSHSNFVPLKYGSSTSPVRERTRSRCPCASSSAQRAAVRRSCQTIALAYGSPVVRSQATTVSRWLVMPIAATCSAPTLSTTSSSVVITAVQISAASCSTQPGWGYHCVNSRYAATGGRSSANTARLRTPVVPASMAITHVRLVTVVTVSAGRRRAQRRRLPGRFARPPPDVRRVGAGR